MTEPHSPLRLLLDGEALVANWKWLEKQSAGAACGAAVKADGYGLGARDVVTRLAQAGCRDFFVATWSEAENLLPSLGEASVSVLHGFAAEDLPRLPGSPARPVLNTPLQVERWKEAGGARPCDVMIDTGMNRLGLDPAAVGEGLLDGLEIDTLMSHLACADEDEPMNGRQLADFREIARRVPAKRRSLANSAGICLGPDYAFDLTRPGLALYGGLPRREARGEIRRVVEVQAQIVQRRRVQAGQSVGYNSTWVAEAPAELAILNIGYADGYLRGFSGTGRAGIPRRSYPGRPPCRPIYAPVVGRVSMDLTAVLVNNAPHLKEGDWLRLDYELLEASNQSGLSQYELLTTLGRRHRRIWK